MSRVLCSAAFLALTLATACGGDAIPPVETGPTGPPSVRFTEPPSGSEMPCISIGDEVDARIPLLVGTEELVLRPPGACGSLLQCGHLQLLAAGVINNQSAVPSIELLMRKLAKRIHDGSPHALTGEPDLLEVTVQVVDDAGQARLDADQEPLEDSLELITVPDCQSL